MNTYLNVVQLMYALVWVFKRTLGATVFYVYTPNICHYDVHEVSVMVGRFQLMYCECSRPPT